MIFFVVKLKRMNYSSVSILRYTESGLWYLLYAYLMVVVYLMVVYQVDVHKALI
jgi:hypothetical protein